MRSRIIARLAALRSRGLLAQSLELAGFAVLAYGVARLAGVGVALVVGGVLLVLLAFEADRP